MPRGASKPMGTRLPSNLKPTTHMRAFSYAWLLTVTWQRWRSRQSIRRCWKPHATSKSHGSMFYRTGVMTTRNFTLGEWGFSTFSSCDLDLDPMTSYTNLTRIPWKYTGCANMNFLSRFRIVWQTHRQTDRHNRNYIPRRFFGWSKMSKNYVGVGHHGNLPPPCYFLLHVRQRSSLWCYL